MIVFGQTRGFTMLITTFIAGGISLMLNPPGVVTKVGAIGKFLQYGPEQVSFTDDEYLREVILRLTQPTDIISSLNAIGNVHIHRFCVMLLNSMGILLTI